MRPASFRFAHALVAGALVAACGGAPPPQAPDLGALPIAPAATTTPKTSGPTALARPDGVVAWVRFDDPGALLDLFGVSIQSLGSHQLPPDALAMLEAIEHHHPLDAVVVATGRSRSDVQIATRFGLRDPKTFFDALGRHLDVVESGDRVHVREKSSASSGAQPDHDEEDVFVCELAGVSGERATCGTPKAMDAVADWLRAAPEPRSEDSVRAGKGPALARAVVYGEALRRITSRHRNDDAAERSLFALLDDVDTISLDLAREENDGLAFVAGVRLRSSSSVIAKEMLAAPNVQSPDDAFFRLWQDTSAVVFTPGGGSLPKWTAELVDSLHAPYDEPANGAAPSAAARAVGKALERPVTIAYGVRADRAKAALAAVRAAKDPQKAVQALERALDGYLVYSVAAEPAAAERAARDVASAWTSAAEARDKKYRSSYPSTRYAVRAAAAKLGLPKGSFFFDITRSDGSQKAGGKTTTTEHVVHVPLAGGTSGISCPDETTCVEGARRVLAAAPAARRELHPLFQRRGVALAGYASSLVGAFTMHRLSLAGSTSGVPTDVLAEIEHDLASPRLELPFVVTTEAHGEAGGIVALEMRGRRDAFKMLAEHASLGGTAGAALLFWAALALGR